MRLGRGYIILGFMADSFGRKPTTIFYYAMCLIMTPVLYLWTQSLGMILDCDGYSVF